MLVVQTPLRISFLGGGTDFEEFYTQYGGAVLSATIDKYIFVILKQRFDEDICVNYSQRETVQKTDDLKHELVREAMLMSGIKKSIEITTLADVPSAGTGLGSSSSVTVGLLQALFAFRGQHKTAHQLANKACEIEIKILGKPIGVQDQYISAYGGLRYITFSHKSINVEKVHISPQVKKKLSNSLMLLYTGKTRKASDILSEQKNNNHANVESLKELAKLAAEAKQTLISGDLDDFGRMLHRGWEIKKCLASKITNTEIDDIYQAALDAGALGGKIAGAGGGGFLLLYCPIHKQDSVRSALKLRELPIQFEEDGSKVIFNYRK